ncbi:MAG TPA: lipoxygenase family protein [Chakrabartia sp.]|jgi:arachidonate 15-lipoxygenase|nr:lipoxygenase family protein [Chakrabartia sp.]
MSLPPVNPTLPQNDTPAQKEARAKQITQACGTYEWTVAIPTLPGVPLASKLPDSNKPTLDWLVLLVGIGVQLVRNQIAINNSASEAQALGVLPTALGEAVVKLAAIESWLAPITAYTPPVHGGSVILQALEKLAGGIVKDLELADINAKIAEAEIHIATLLDLISKTAPTGNGPVTLEEYRKLFATFAVPGIAYEFVSDEIFAHLRVAGPNPMLIKSVDALPANFGLTEAQYAAVVTGDTLSAALAAGRVFLCDYAVLEVLEPGTWNGIPKYPVHPIALFAVPPQGDALVPVAIQCGQDSTQYPVFTPAPIAGNRWGWEMAKSIVQVADGNWHELIAHLAHTHLLIESVAVSAHRNLADVHPVWALLLPHFEGTLFINDAAATSLIAQHGPIDHIFAGTITSTQTLAIQARLGFDFAGRMPPQDFATRGVANPATLPHYPYRDDALRVWAAIRGWAADYLAVYYTDDAAVAADTELSAWVHSVQVEAKVTGFPTITTRDQLADTCAMIMFTASAQHAAVNFPQRDVMSFAPAISGAIWAQPPAQQSGQDKTGWLEQFLPLPLALEQLNVLMLLGSIHYRPLGDYHSNTYPYGPWFQDPAIIGADGPLARFQAVLKEVEAKIVADNANRLFPYPYLQPSLIPTSINI